jgi:MFS family permease
VASQGAVAEVTSPLARSLPGASLWRDRQFVTLAAGMALGLFAQIGLIAHLFSVLAPPLGPQGAGFAMALATASAIAGRMLVGWLMPVRADRRLVASASYAVQVAGSLMLLAADGTHVPLLLAGIVLFGAGIGNATSLPPLIAQVEFVAGDVSRVVSLIVAVGQAAYAFAPAAFGVLRTASSGSGAWAMGESTLLFGAAALVQVLTIGCVLAGRRR